ncbi:hypothetical protein TSUD_264920 [Trifolium subterraneum]|uniref:Response regulatory domain-containing protein n=1 Tax=Trifolium subterraneum TaxID=3900 RepID=A0A2Z6M6M5_TRISU|nr:hypothetical protein TSUD_264920 [Trifolium subterraneum]
MALFANHPSSFPAGLQILAVDHHVAALCTIQDICNNLSCQVITCCSVSDAWNYLFAQNFDIILIEACMPSNDTFAFVGQMTSLFKFPVIVMSLDHTPSCVMQSIAKGSCAFWSKPLHENQFKNMWQHVVRNTLSESQLHVARMPLATYIVGLGQYRLNLMAFCKDLNARTQKFKVADTPMTATITAYKDNTFE